MGLKISKYAGIDIGSNAIRLLIMFVYELENQPTQYKKSSLVRVPIRLGADVFFNGKVSEHNIARMEDSMQAFSLLLKAHGVDKYRACATSAMREAKNGAEVVRSEEHTSELQSRGHLVCRLLLEKKKIMIRSLV